MSGPSVSLLQGSETVETVDSAGRVLTVRPPHAVDQLRLFKAVGPILAQNQPYLAMAIVACSVIAIDGVPVPIPSSEHQIESLIQRLGDEGLQAASAFLGPCPSDDEVRDKAGNSAGIPI